VISSTLISKHVDQQAVISKHGGSKHGER